MKQISAVTGVKVQDYLSVHDAAGKMDIDHNTLTQCCEGNNNYKISQFFFQYLEDNDNVGYYLIVSLKNLFI